MTAAVIYGISCDSCGESEDSFSMGYPSTKAVRDAFKKAGWVQRGKKDYCKECAVAKPWLSTPVLAKGGAA